MGGQWKVGVGPWLAIAVSGAACGNAKITRFEATPRHICPGDRVALVWDFTGSGTMTVTPPTAHVPVGDVRDRGSVAIHPLAATQVRLAVTRTWGKSAGAQLDIEMAPGETVAASIADASAACQGGTVSSTAHLGNFAPGLAAAMVGVAPGDARDGYDVTRIDPGTHQPVTAHISPGAPTTRFAGMPIGGDWAISSKLAAGESCDAPRLPNNLVVVAYTSCAGEGGGP
jgi:hypothetical protein